MFGNRADIDVEDLLKVILVLVAIWIVVSIAGMLVESLTDVLGLFQPVLGLIVLALIVLWLLDRL